jgi:hypothetical protein
MEKYLLFVKHVKFLVFRESPTRGVPERVLGQLAMSLQPRGKWRTWVRVKFAVRPGSGQGARAVPLWVRAGADSETRPSCDRRVGGVAGAVIVAASVAGHPLTPPNTRRISPRHEWNSS